MRTVKSRIKYPKLILRPMPLCAVACIAVSVCAFYFGIAALILMGVLLPVVVFIAFKAPRTLIPILLVCVMLITTALSVAEVHEYSDLNGSKKLLEFAVSEEPYENDFGYSVKVYSKGKLLNKNSEVMLYFPKDITLTAGKIYSAVVTLNTIEENKAYFYSENIFITATMVGKAQCIGSDILLSAVSSVRRYVKETLYSHVDRDAAATLNALTVGEKRYFDMFFSDNVRRAGVSHMMVVSGMHLSIIMAAVFFVIDRIKRNKYTRLIVSLLCVFFISVVCGFTVSVIRAGLTFVIMSLAPAVSRESDSLNNLGLAAVIILIRSPFAAFSVSFQLSSLATFGILVMAPLVINEIKYRMSYKIRWLIDILSLAIDSVSATVFTLPVIVYHFEEVSVVSVLSNVLISYAVTAAIICCIAAMILNLLPISGALVVPIFKVCELLAKYINAVINFFGELKFAVVAVPKNTAFIIALIPAAVFFLPKLYDFIMYRRFYREIYEE